MCINDQNPGTRWVELHKAKGVDEGRAKILTVTKVVVKTGFQAD